MFHQRWSNLSSAEPGSTLIIDKNQVQATMCCTNVKLYINWCGSAEPRFWTVVIRPGRWLVRFDGDQWRHTYCLHYFCHDSQGRPPVANVFSRLSAMFFLAVIFWLHHHHAMEIRGWSKSTVTHSLTHVITRAHDFPRQKMRFSAAGFCIFRGVT